MPPIRPKKRYRLYIDESGDHTYISLDQIGKRYLGLTGCLIWDEYYRTEFQPDIEALKQRHFPHSPDEPIIFHRREIIYHSGSFWRLRDAEVRRAFDQDLLTFFLQKNFTVIAVVIDKKTHVERYGEIAFHPYHYCLIALMERYCGYLNFHNAHGDVMAESRGGKEDSLLKDAYRSIYENGSQFRNAEFFNKVLTSKDLKIKPKTANIAGLQLSDLLAYPTREEILLEQKRIADPGNVFSKEICRVIAGKYNRQIFQGRTSGYGKIFLA